jgi:outer membrane protein OmpA-like peptidoglycan-associated protein
LDNASPTPDQIVEEAVAGPFGKYSNTKIRTALLAGTTLALVVAAQSGTAGNLVRSEPGTIVVAQGNVANPNDPKTKRGQNTQSTTTPKAANKPNTGATTQQGGTATQRATGTPTVTNKPNTGRTTTQQGGAGTGQRVIGAGQGQTGQGQQNLQTNTRSNQGTGQTWQGRTGQGQQNLQTNTRSNQGTGQTGQGQTGQGQQNLQTNTRSNQGLKTWQGRTGQGQGVAGTPTQGGANTQGNINTQQGNRWRGQQGTQGSNLTNLPGTGGAGWRGQGTGQAITNIDQLRSHRTQKRDASGALIIQEPNRVIFQTGGRNFVRRDDTLRFRFGANGDFRTVRRGNENFVYINRGNYQIVNVMGPDGRLLRRSRIGRDGREHVLFRNTVVAGAVATGFLLALAAPRVIIPHEHYVVDVSHAQPTLLYETLDAPLVAPLDRTYSMDEIRYNVNLRAYVRALDLNSITFDSGSWELGQEQYPKLEAVAEAIRRILAHNPNSIILVEGHTDKVGDTVDNLALSDERANTVAEVLTSAFGIPPENLVTQGYGEQHPKIDQEGSIRENRRVMLRNVTRLLSGS